MSERVYGVVNEIIMRNKVAPMPPAPTDCFFCSGGLYRQHETTEEEKKKRGKKEEKEKKGGHVYE